MKKSTVMVIPDVHAPLQDEKAINCVIQAVGVVKPTAVVILGDWGEWNSVSPWKYKKKKRPPLEYVTPLIDEDAKASNRLLDRFDTAFLRAHVKNKYFMMGNHEVWLDSFVDEYPYLDKYSPTKLLKLKLRKYNVTEYGNFLRIGKLTYYHGGHYNGVNHVRRHLQHLGVNIMYAHYHNIASDSITRLDGTYAGYCIGTLKKCDHSNNKWLKGRPINWGLCFAVVNYAQNGTFGVDMINITDGRCYVWGEEIQG